MPILVNLPDGSQASFPDDTPPEAMKAAIQKKFPPQQAPVASVASPASTYDPGLANLVPGSKAPDLGYVNETPPSQHFGMSSSDTLNPLPALSTFGNELAGAVPIAGPTLRNMGENFDAAVDNMVYRPLQGLKGVTSPEDVAASNAQGVEANPEAAIAGQVTGSVAPYVMAGGVPMLAKGLGLAGTTMQRLGYGVGSQYGINVADEMAHGKSLPDALIGSVIPTAVAAPFFLMGGGKTTKPTEAPSVQALKDDAGKIYEQARASGVVMPQSVTIALADNMFQVAQKAGIVSPTGKIAKGYGKIADAVDHFDQFSNGVMTVEQMQATRKLLQDAAGSIDKGERRVGTMMLKSFDKVVAQGVPQLAEAAPIYHRAMKGETVQKAVGKAERKAGQFTQSGDENALRTTFRSLEDKIDEGKLRGFTADETAAIKAVSRGTKAVNGLRAIGRFAPKGPVSMGASVLGPVIAGTAAGQPGLGALAAMLMAGAGTASHAGAGALAKRNAAIASALVRRGGSAPEVERAGLLASPELASIGRALATAPFHQGQ